MKNTKNTPEALASLQYYEKAKELIEGLGIGARVVDFDGERLSIDLFMGTDEKEQSDTVKDLSRIVKCDYHHDELVVLLKLALSLTPHMVIDETANIGSAERGAFEFENDTKELLAKLEETND